MKSVVMIGGGLQQVEAVNEAKKLGFFVIVTDKNESAPCFKNADLSVVLDGNDDKGISEFINKNKKRFNILGVFTCVNLASTVANVAKQCQLPAVAPEAAELGDNKFEQKKILAKHKIPTPFFLTVNTLNQAKVAHKKIGQKVVIKPIDSFGGQGVKIVNNEKELKEGFRAIYKYSKKKTAIIEEFVTGHFADLEGIFYNNVFFQIAIVDSYFITEYPKGNLISPIEYKNVYPSIVDKQTEDKLFKIMENAARVLGINFGPVAADMVITNKGLLVIEMSARLHGSSSNLFLIPEASGIRPVELLIKVLTGQPVSKKEITKKFNKVGIYKYLLTKEGTIKKISGLNKMKKLKDLKKIFLFKKVGDNILYRNSTDVPASLTVVSKTLKKAESTIKEAKSEIIFEFEN